MAYVVPTRRQGMGDLPLCADLAAVASNSYGPPTPCDDSRGPRPVYDFAASSATQGDTDALWKQVLSQQQSSADGSIAQWVNQHVGTIALVIVGVLTVGILRR